MIVDVSIISYNIASYFVLFAAWRELVKFFKSNDAVTIQSRRSLPFQLLCVAITIGIVQSIIGGVLSTISFSNAPATSIVIFSMMLSIIVAGVSATAYYLAGNVMHELGSDSKMSFSHEGIFLIGENYGSKLGGFFFVAIGFVFFFIGVGIILSFFVAVGFLYYGVIGLWILSNNIRMINSVVNLELDVKEIAFRPVILLKIAGLSLGLIATILIFSDAIAIVGAITPKTDPSGELVMFSMLNSIVMQSGILFAIASLGCEVASDLLTRNYIAVHSTGRGKEVANHGMLSSLAMLGVSILIFFTTISGFITSDIILLVIVCVLGIFNSTFMGTALKIYYYKLMNEQASVLFDSKESILTVNDVKTYFPIRSGLLSRTIGYVKAVDGVSFDIKHGETLALVGESGCGKTTIGRTILGLVKRNSGDILFNGREIPLKFPPYLRRRIQLIFQDPDSSLNPRMNIIQSISEPLRNLNPELTSDEIRMRVLELMNIVSMKYEHLFRFPHEFSGGQKQRIVIARALACSPDFIVLDEPTSALDVSVQAQILNLLKDLQQKFNLSYLFITHNLSVVHHIASRVAVMYLGKLVELGPVNEIFDNPRHPYTRALLSARSIPDPEKARHRIILKGDVPSPINPPSGCPFNPRCFYQLKSARCKVEPPIKIEVSPDHFVWSSLHDENACWREFIDETVDISAIDSNLPDTE